MPPPECIPRPVLVVGVPLTSASYDLAYPHNVAAVVDARIALADPAHPPGAVRPGCWMRLRVSLARAVTLAPEAERLQHWRVPLAPVADGPAAPPAAESIVRIVLDDAEHDLMRDGPRYLLALANRFDTVEGLVLCAGHAEDDVSAEESVEAVVTAGTQFRRVAYFTDEHDVLPGMFVVAARREVTIL